MERGSTWTAPLASLLLTGEGPKPEVGLSRKEERKSQCPGVKPAANPFLAQVRILVKTRKPIKATATAGGGGGLALTVAKGRERCRVLSTIQRQKQRKGEGSKQQAEKVSSCFIFWQPPRHEPIWHWKPPTNPTEVAAEAPAHAPDQRP